VYGLLLSGAAFAIAFAACILRNPKLENAFAVAAGVSFFGALLASLILLVTGRLPNVDMEVARRETYDLRNPLVRAVLIGSALVACAFSFEVLPYLMGLNLGAELHWSMAAMIAIYGYLIYAELVRLRRKNG
jgi:hypothetical protein